MLALLLLLAEFTATPQTSKPEWVHLLFLQYETLARHIKGLSSNYAN